MAELFPLVHDAPAQVIDEVRDLILRYPQVDVFRNWLCGCLRLLHRPVEARETAEATFREFPGYLFGRTTLAELQLEAGDCEAAQQTLGGISASLPAMFPRRRRFHVSEVRHWFLVQGKLHLMNGRIEAARDYREMLNQMEPGSQAVKALDRLLQPENLGRFQVAAALSKLKSLAQTQTASPRKGTQKAPAKRPGDEHPELFTDLNFSKPSS